VRFIKTENFAVADRRLANTVSWHLNPPPNFNMRIPDEVRKCVVYLGSESGNGSPPQNIKYGGTGFFIGVGAKKVPDASFMFLVTAKHVADALKGKTVWVRVNRKNGTSMNLKVNEPTKWFFHPTDKAADVALMPISLPIQEYDFSVLPSAMILTEEMRLEKGIGIGDSVFITGLFVYHHGFSKNIPILRTGNIAMISEERIPIKNFGDMEAYLIEARSIGGLSGSPVFTLARSPEQVTVILMGLMHGHWSVDSETVTDKISQDAGIKAGVNVGIAIVTPASKIMDIINGNELGALLDEYEARETAKNSPTPDKI
jgi:hypothetical protein